MLKLADNPPALSPNGRPLADFQGVWCVAHTKARFEKALAWDLVMLGVSYFLPMIQKTRTRGRRTLHVLLPLFPSYAFVCLGESDRARVLATGRICQLIKVPDQFKLISELNALHKAIMARAELELCPAAPPGQRCRITAGPLRDLEGLVVRQATGSRLVLQVSMLGQGAAVEIASDLLEPIDSSPAPPANPRSIAGTLA